MLNIDMWYGNTPKEAERISVFFNDLNAEYSGWIYKNGQIVGDFSCDDCMELKAAFPQIAFNWD